MDLKKILRKYIDQCPSRCYILSNIPESKKHDALSQFNLNEFPELITEYGGDISTKDFLLFYDDSLWGNCKGGIIFTEKMLFLMCYGDNMVYYLLWDEINDLNITSTWNKINIQYLIKGQWYEYAVFGDEDVCLFLDSIFTEISKNNLFEHEKTKKIESDRKKKLYEKSKAVQEKKKREAADKRATALKETELRDNKRREQQEQERKKKELERQKNIDSKNKIRYFIEDEKSSTAKGPFTQQDIQSMLDENKINLKTKIKKGIDTNTFKSVVKFKEFTEGFEDFL